MYDKIKELVERSTLNNVKLVKMNINSQTDYTEAINILNNDICEYTSMHTICNFLQFISTSNEIKKSCSQSDSLLTNYIVALNFDEKIYIGK